MTEFKRQRFDPIPLDIVPPLPGDLDRCCWYTSEGQVETQHGDGSATKTIARCVLHDGHDELCRWARHATT